MLKNSNLEELCIYVADIRYTRLAVHFTRGPQQTWGMGMDNGGGETNEPPSYPFRPYSVSFNFTFDTYFVR